jgi:hypothetical protein
LVNGPCFYRGFSFGGMFPPAVSTAWKKILSSHLINTVKHFAVIHLQYESTGPDISNQQSFKMEKGKMVV